ncbi:unnamed protein product [Rotaria magnacalcarata]|uniref:G-protein coupled receptors family 1 profile domain-containing protein n=2 Tax=Rotaria magnacalcarata TaxID=392030 RepID=A0A814ZY41_9BILA|nr:unnamed protein product [Rotaria magnacalcarata]CAF1487520.1 unnamed protein product [Rotaria magnacalcarata]CAF1935246.1 unnamed protein product [Rotaria magnacalcarata]CAF2092617.1 unnamed protein product [Rotaria magnacalcarata]CAF3878682.1 unnamed protein product [Rotaria magnacalcarata]
MLYVQLFILSIIGFIGIVFNWLLILAIQRKTYHYQYSQRNPSPMPTKSLLRARSSVAAQLIQAPLLPSVRSSISIFDKFILAFLINDIFVCNFLLPLRLVDLSTGLPFGFLCFILKAFEKLTAMIELIIISSLVIISLIYFWKKHLLTEKLWFVLFMFMLPILVTGFLPTLTYIDVEEHEFNSRPPTCKQIYIYIDLTTYKTLNIFCCLMTYFMTFMSFILLIKMQSAIRAYKKKTLKNLTEAAIASKVDVTSSEQGTHDYNRHRSMYYSASITVEPMIPGGFNSSVKSSSEPIDYVTYLAVAENSHTLVRSTCLILLIYLLLYIPYWFYELFHTQIFYRIKDILFLCHIVKPFCYMSTNEKYRHHCYIT